MKTPSEILKPSEVIASKFENGYTFLPWSKTLVEYLDSHAAQLAAQGEQLARVMAYVSEHALFMTAREYTPGRLVEAARAFLTPPAKAEAPREGQEWPKWTVTESGNTFTRYGDERNSEHWCKDGEGKTHHEPNGTPWSARAMLGEVEITHAEAIALIPAIAKDFPLPAEASEFKPHDDACANCGCRASGHHTVGCEGNGGRCPCPGYKARPTPTAKGPGCSSSQSPSSASPSTSSQTGDQTTPTCGSPDAGSLEQRVDAFMRKWLNNNGRFNDIRDTQTFAAAFAAQHTASLEARVKDLHQQRADENHALRTERDSERKIGADLRTKLSTAETALAAANKRVEAMGLGLYELSRANAIRQGEWDPSDKITLSFRGNELAGETGEACNVIKKLDREKMGLRGTRATKEQLAEELADVVICADLIAMTAGIDLGTAIVAKFNATSEKYGLKTKLALAQLGGGK